MFSRIPIKKEEILWNEEKSHAWTIIVMIFTNVF